MPQIDNYDKTVSKIPNWVGWVIFGCWILQIIYVVPSMRSHVFFYPNHKIQTIIGFLSTLAVVLFNYANIKFLVSNGAFKDRYKNNNEGIVWVLRGVFPFFFVVGFMQIFFDFSDSKLPPFLNHKCGNAFTHIYAISDKLHIKGGGAGKWSNEESNQLIVKDVDSRVGNIKILVSSIDLNRMKIGDEICVTGIRSIYGVEIKSDFTEGYGAKDSRACR